MIWRGKKQKISYFLLLFSYLILISNCLTLCGCAALMAELKTQFEVDPAPALKSALLRSPAEWQISLSRAQTWDWEIRRQYKLGGGYLQEKVQKVANKIVAVSHFKDFPIKVKILENPNENAFATGGEYIYVHTGLLNHVESEDEISFVIAHEIAHNFAGHIYRGQKTRIWTNLALALADWVFKGQTADEIISFAHKYFPAAYSRTHEREADILGTSYAHKAGYDFLKATKLFERMWAEEEKYKTETEENLRRLSYQYQIALASQNQKYIMQVYNEYQKAVQEYMKMMEQTYYFRTHPPFPERISLISQTIDVLERKRNLDICESSIQYVLKSAEGIIMGEMAPSGLAQVEEDKSLFYVYLDNNSPNNHFIPSGWMGDWQDIRIDYAWKSNPFSGNTCIKFVYSAKATQGRRWAAVFWQNPANNWGTIPNAGFNLTGLTKLTFWARGEKGGERIEEIKIGGIMDKYPDSDTVSIGPIVLTPEWKQYTVNLSGKDLSHIIGGFCWATNADVNPKGAVFYFDDVKYEK